MIYFFWVYFIIHIQHIWQCACLCIWSMLLGREKIVHIMYNRQLYYKNMYWFVVNVFVSSCVVLEYIPSIIAYSSHNKYPELVILLICGSTYYILRFFFTCCSFAMTPPLLFYYKKIILWYFFKFNFFTGEKYWTRTSVKWDCYKNYCLKMVISVMDTGNVNLDGEMQVFFTLRR